MGSIRRLGGHLGGVAEEEEVERSENKELNSTGEERARESEREVAERLIIVRRSERSKEQRRGLRTGTGELSSRKLVRHGF